MGSSITTFSSLSSLSLMRLNISVTQTQLSKYTVDKLIMGADALNLNGVSSFNFVGDFVLKQMIRQSRERILLADSSKIGKVAFAHFAELTDFDVLITNQDPATESILDEIRHLGLKVIVV